MIQELVGMIVYYFVIMLSVFGGNALHVYWNINLVDQFIYNVVPRMKLYYELVHARVNKWLNPTLTPEPSSKRDLFARFPPQPDNLNDD